MARDLRNAGRKEEENYFEVCIDIYIHAEGLNVNHEENFSAFARGNFRGDFVRSEADDSHLLELSFL